ncbi:MAG: outer membrane beta-barrel protein [Flavisolibacter sp.]
MQPELIFSSKGNRSYNQIGNDELTTKYNYLNMPILLAYKIDHRTSLFLGPELGYLTTVYLYINSSKVNVSKNYPPKFDLGLAVGLNYKLVENIGIVVRYNYGFKTIYSTDAVGNRYNDYNGGHRVLQIGLNYLFLK